MLTKKKFEIILHLIKTKAYKISKITSVGGLGEVVVSLLVHFDVVVVILWGLRSRSRGNSSWELLDEVRNQTCVVLRSRVVWCLCYQTSKGPLTWDQQIAIIGDLWCCARHPLVQMIKGCSGRRCIMYDVVSTHLVLFWSLLDYLRSLLGHLLRGLRI